MPTATLYSYPLPPLSRVPGQHATPTRRIQSRPALVRTVTRLADSRMLSLGWDYVQDDHRTAGLPRDYHGGTQNRSVETDPAGGYTSVSTLRTPRRCGTTTTPTYFSFPTSRAELLLMFGQAGSVFFAPMRGRASHGGPGEREAAGTAPRSSPIAAHLRAQCRCGR